ncbi:rhodanese-like domain-containing protein [Hirsutella rhossiliensis]|uniref:Rhodanese-like domain-containing protein n=1 Tax=Hirsutella rhossiliensis TaxID=111463 RepID=A0A9P8SI72_9HYPO|nr:rhodanese-like domain-containing protein [Hirsutella rhossiliensis]KAH0962315.1 rhodanese-like domain-containing protein [Hirsutella rhossiliensis]
MSTAAGAEQQADSPPWWASLPEPKASCRRLEPADVMQLLESQSNLDARRHRSFLLVDVRRTDWEGGTLASSINLPAQSFYQTRPVVYQLCKQAGVKTIIFYCGSSTGRGPRCAGWMQDYCDEMGELTMIAAVLKGGISGWQEAYGGRMLDWYDEKCWAKSGS